MGFCQYRAPQALHEALCQDSMEDKGSLKYLPVSLTPLSSPCSPHPPPTFNLNLPPLPLHKILPHIHSPRSLVHFCDVGTINSQIMLLFSYCSSFLLRLFHLEFTNKYTIFIFSLFVLSK